MGLKKKKEQLGIHPSTAAAKLRKELLFHYAKKCGDNFCTQCGAEIENIEEFSIEHIVPWLDSANPLELYFDLDNIGFSHLKCNIAAARKVECAHPSRKAYEVHGCRCEECKELQRNRKRKQRNKTGA